MYARFRWAKKRIQNYNGKCKKKMILKVENGTNMVSRSFGMLEVFGRSLAHLRDVVKI